MSTQNNDIVFDADGAPLGVNWKAVLAGSGWPQGDKCMCDFPNVGHALTCSGRVE